MRRKFVLLLSIVCFAAGCDTFEFNFGTAKCESQDTVEEYLFTQDDFTGLNPDRTEVAGIVTMEIGRYYQQVCPGDSVHAFFEADLVDAPPVAVFVGSYIVYDEEMTNLTVDYESVGNFDRYSGSARAKTPRKYEGNSYGVVVHLSFEPQGSLSDDVEMVKTVLKRLMISVSYRKVQE